MPRDFKWCSNGGLLIDGSGDIACTGADTLESTIDIVRSRLKAALWGWKLYPIGADLQERIGDTVEDETEIAIRRQVTQCLTSDFLRLGDFQVETLRDVDRIHVFVYINRSLVATTSVVLDRSAQ